MDAPSKPGSARGLISRFLIFAVAALLIRFVYVVAVHGSASSCAFSGGFCLLSRPESPLAFPGGGGAAFIRVADGSGSSSVSPAVRALWTSREWRKSADFYSAVFQNFMAEGFLSPSSNALCADAAPGHEVLAMKELGITDSIGVSRKASPPLVVSGDLRRLPFHNSSFDFIFSSRGTAELAEEISRTLRPQGYLALHTTEADDDYSLQSLLDLFPSCRMVISREIPCGNGNKNQDSSPILEVVLQKVTISDNVASSSVNKCSVPEHKRQLLKSAEPLIDEEPLKPWITLKRNIKNMKYLPSMANISFKRRYVYIDVGARNYGSSIGSWFRKQYPKQNHTFEIHAIEADPIFHKEYAMKKHVKLMPYAAWIRNETLYFEVSHESEQKSEEKGKEMGRIKPVTANSGQLSSKNLHKVEGFDFAEWLKATVTKRDFVVVKMDVEGTEFDLIPWLFETGAICLIDELFLECHYNRWQKCCPGERSPKYKNTYDQCMGLFTSLRERGVLVHQWW